MSSRRLLPLLALALLAAMFVAGCGDDDGGGGETVTVTASETTATDTDTVETETTETTAGPAKRGPAFFSTPSKNISCQVTPEFARCDIAKKDWKPTKPEEPCELDYGQGIQFFDDHAEFVCAGDTALGAPTVLPYGSDAQRGLILCASAPDGVTCSDVETGHGFFISRGSYRIF